MSTLLIVTSLVAIGCAVYGVHSFHDAYTCGLMRFFSSCGYWTTLPSAVLVACVLCALLVKTVYTPGGLSLDTSSFTAPSFMS